MSCNFHGPPRQINGCIVGTGYYTVGDCCALDRLICLCLHRVLAGTAHLCRLTIHLLHHCHLQAELEENDRRGMLLYNPTVRTMHSLRYSDRTCFIFTASVAETFLSSYYYKTICKVHEFSVKCLNCLFAGCEASPEKDIHDIIRHWWPDRK